MYPAQMNLAVIMFCFFSSSELLFRIALYGFLLHFYIVGCSNCHGSGRFFSPRAPRYPVSPCVIVHVIHLCLANYPSLSHVFKVIVCPMFPCLVLNVFQTVYCNSTTFSSFQCSSDCDTNVISSLFMTVT